MGKRYAYWKRPDGQRDKSEDGKCAPTSLLAEVGNQAKLGEDGNISWPSTSTFQTSNIIQSALAIFGPDSEELNITDANKITSDAVHTAIRETGGGTAIAPKMVIELADRGAAAHLRKKERSYVLICTLSVKVFPVRRIRLNGCTISPLKSRHKYALPSVLTGRYKNLLYIQHLENSSYLPVRVSTVGRTIHEAKNRALDALHLLRGIWTLSAIIGVSGLRLSDARRHPIGVIHTGHVHTLHHLDGSPADDVYWYESQYQHDHKLFSPRNGWGEFDRSRVWATRRLSQLPFRPDVEKLGSVPKLGFRSFR